MLLTQTFERSGPGFPDRDDCIPLHRNPIQSVESVTYTDSEGTSQTLDPSGYTLDFGNRAIYPVGTWPSVTTGHRAVVVNYTAGEVVGTEVPRLLIQAILILTEKGILRVRQLGTDVPRCDPSASEDFVPVRPSRTRHEARESIHRATFELHNGNQDEHGNPTYPVDKDWTRTVIGWPCQVLTVAGGEGPRGRQVSASTTHILKGEYHGASGVTPEMRCTVGNATFYVVKAIDREGLARTMEVEVKQSV